MADNTETYDSKVDLATPESPTGEGPSNYDLIMSDLIDLEIKRRDHRNGLPSGAAASFYENNVEDGVAAAQDAVKDIDTSTLSEGFIQLTPDKDINLQATFINNNAVANILSSITGIKASDLISGDADLNQTAINLADKISNFGIQTIVNIGLTSEKAISDFIDLKLTGENRWGPWRKAGEFIPEGDDLPKSVVGMITSKTGDPATFIRKKVLNQIFGNNSPGADGNPFAINADMNNDGYFSENEHFDFGTGKLENILADYNQQTYTHRYSENPSFTHEQINKDPKVLKNLFSTMQADKKMPSYRIPKVKAHMRNNSFKDPLRKSVFVDAGSDYNSVIPMGFDVDEIDGSIILPKGQDVPKDLTDDAAYMPLSFTDMRPIGDTANAQLRTVYFRPIITAFNEDFAPEWNKQSYYGRSDQVVTYNSTIRTAFITFELHAMQRKDVDVIFKKLNWLTSMVYPQYDHELLLKAGPVCRMRIGDVFSAGFKRGLTGVIDSLSMDYSDSIWELDEGSKAPRSVSVNISFHVLHDSIIGLNNEGNFGGIGRVDEDGRYVNDPNSIISDSFRGMGNIDKVK